MNFELSLPAVRHLQGGAAARNNAEENGGAGSNFEFLILNCELLGVGAELFLLSDNARL
jgi:hypothetical protein